MDENQKAKMEAMKKQIQRKKQEQELLNNSLYQECLTALKDYVIVQDETDIRYLTSLVSSNDIESHSHSEEVKLADTERYYIVWDNMSVPILESCYPLHPVSTFILPRLSERIAQNERTLFTFISSPGTSTLPAFLDKYNDDRFDLITPDVIYDYFEPLFKKEAYSGSIHENYRLTEVILERLDPSSLESKIVKTLSLIYILEQFEKLQPSKDELISIYSARYEVVEINRAIDDLIEQEYVIYLKRSNNFLRLKQTSGVDVRRKINDLIELQKNRVTIKETLNSSNFDNYMYPSRYNNDRDMTRYFSFEFIDEEEITEDIDWNKKSESVEADGVIYGIIPHSEEAIEQIKKVVLNTSKECRQQIFVIPKHYKEIENIVREFNAVSRLRDEANDDKILFEEYEVIYEDLREVISLFMRGYTRPEEYKSEYIFCGNMLNIKRKAELTELMSRICDEVFALTPVINNEAMNRNEITSIANNSRTKIIAALLRNELETNLGFTGSGQEVSIMRSTLIRTGILEDRNGIPQLNLRPDVVPNIDVLLATIEGFVIETRQAGRLSFGELYNRLLSPEYHIGLRRGLIPIYIAAVLHEYKREVAVSDMTGQLPLNADTLLQLNSKPEQFYISYLDWSPEKENFINILAEAFDDYVVEAEKSINSYDYVVTAMHRWYMSLPKYAKDSKKAPDGGKLRKDYQEMMKLFKQNVNGNELLFEKLPKAFGLNEFHESLADNITSAKEYYDSYLSKVKKALRDEIKNIFAIQDLAPQVHRMSLSSVIKDWCESIDRSAFEQLFADGTDRCLGLFKNISNDDDATISRLAKLSTDLRLEDWDDKIRDLFLQNVRMYKQTAEGHHGIQNENTEGVEASAYQISFTDDRGEMVTKRFEHVENTGKGKLLHNQVTAALDSIGRSISTLEKRQILMEILKTMCY